MAQIPTTERTYSRLNVLKAKAIVERNGESVTWDNVISTLCDVAGNHNSEFVEFVKNKSGKQGSPRNNGEGLIMEEISDIEEAKEKLKDGKAVTSEQLEKLGKAKRLKE